MVNWFRKFARSLSANRDQSDKGDDQQTSRETYIDEQSTKDEPWAVFEIAGFETSGRIKVVFNWNKAFIEKANELGFQAETEEDTVQLFFYTAQMRPTELSGGDDPVQSTEHPTLSSQQNILRT